MEARRIVRILRIGVIKHPGNMMAVATVAGGVTPGIAVAVWVHRSVRAAVRCRRHRGAGVALAPAQFVLATPLSEAVSEKAMHPTAATKEPGVVLQMVALMV